MDTTSISSSWATVFSFIGGVSTVLIPLLVIRYLDRKKRWIEEREAAARTELALVNTRSVELRDDLAIGEGVGDMLTTLMQAGETISKQQRRIFELEQGEIELIMARADIKILKGLLDAHGISYSEKDLPRTKDYH